MMRRGKAKKAKATKKAKAKKPARRAKKTSKKRAKSKKAYAKAAKRVKRFSRKAARRTKSKKAYAKSKKRHVRVKQKRKIAKTVHAKPSRSMMFEPLEQVAVKCSNCGREFNIVKLHGLSTEGMICQRCAVGEIEFPE